MAGMMLLATFLASAALILAAELPEQHKHSKATLRLNSTTLHSSGEWFEVWPAPAHVVRSMLCSRLCHAATMYTVQPVELEKA